MQEEGVPDHFALLGLAPAFAIDRERLDHAWREVQARVHPDRHAAGTAQDRRAAMQWASLANEAYRVLRSPLARARYLCERAGVDPQVETNTAMPPAFLMQQMAWREALDDIRASRDQSALDALLAELGAALRAIAVEVGELIDGKHDMAAAAARIREWMFLEKLREEADRVADEFAA